MKVTVVKSEDTRDYRNLLEIFVNDEQEFYAVDGEPEDNTLCRNFNDCYSIPALMRAAYEAGKRGEEFVLEEKTEDWCA